jgi:hypothetical protein
MLLWRKDLDRPRSWKAWGSDGSYHIWTPATPAPSRWNYWVHFLYKLPSHPRPDKYPGGYGDIFDTLAEAKVWAESDHQKRRNKETQSRGAS